MKEKVKNTSKVDEGLAKGFTSKHKELWKFIKFSILGGLFHFQKTYSAEKGTFSSLPASDGVHPLLLGIPPSGFRR